MWRARRIHLTSACSKLSSSCGSSHYSIYWCKWRCYNYPQEGHQRRSEKFITIAGYVAISQQLNTFALAQSITEFGRRSGQEWKLVTDRLSPSAQLRWHTSHSKRSKTIENSSLPWIEESKKLKTSNAIWSLKWTRLRHEVFANSWIGHWTRR